MLHEFKARMKRGKPIASKDKNPRKRREAKNKYGQIEDTVTLKECTKIPNSKQYFSPVKTQILEIYKNEVISTNYAKNGIKLNQNEVNIDNIFAYNIVLNVINNEDHEPKFVEECKQRNCWPEWKNAIESD